LLLWLFTFSESLSRVVHAVTLCPIETWSAPSEAYLIPHLMESHFQSQS
jgi:hypothetical protein